MSKNVLHFSPNNSFDKEVIQASKTNPVVVDFFATWCGPCKKLSPILEEASSKFGFKLVVVDVEQNNEISSQFNVSSIPHVFLFHKGSQVMDFRGLDPNSVQKMLDYIRKNFNKFSGKGVSVGGNQIAQATMPLPMATRSSCPPLRRFLCINTIGQVKAYVRSKTGVSNISIFTPFPRKVYDDDNAILLDVGLSKREMLNVGLV